MIGKLFKHEWLRTWKLALVVIGGVALISGLGSLATNFFPGPMGAIAGVLAAVLAFVLPFAVMLGLGVDFYRSCYGRTGYLTAALPVRGSTIFWVKLAYAYLVTFVAIAVGVLFGVIAVVSLTTMDPGVSFADGWAEVGQILEVAGQLPLWMKVGLALIIVCYPLSGLAQYWFAVTVGSESWINKLGLGGVVLMWFAYYIGAQVLAVIALFIPPYLNLSNPHQVTVSASPAVLFSEASDAMLPLVALVIGFVLAIVAIVWAKVSYDRRLELR